MRFLIDTQTGLLNPTPIHSGRHNRVCIVRNGGDPDDLDWEGKPSFKDLRDLLSETEENDKNDENADPNVSPHKVRVIEKLRDDGRARATDVSEDMKILTAKIGYTRKNANNKSITYNCKHYRGNGCKAKMRNFNADAPALLPVTIPVISSEYLQFLSENS